MHEPGRGGGGNTDGEGVGEVKKRKKTPRSCRFEVGNVGDLGGNRKKV